MREASCWTDHRLVRAKLHIDLPRMHHGEKRMLPFAVYKLVSIAARDEYRCHLEFVARSPLESTFDLG